MYEIISLIKRNIKIYLRDPLAVFFSFLSTIMLMFIYIIFLGDVSGAELSALLSPGELDLLIYSNMMAGVIVLNTLTIPLGNLGTIISDFEYNRMNAFMVTPVKRYKIILGYYFASLLITLTFSLMIWWLASIVLGLVTGIFYTFSTVMTISGLIVVFVFISTSFMILLTTFIKSVNAFGAVSGIFGSIIGFVSGIYIPLTSSSPSILRHISSVVPFTHMTLKLKEILLKPSLDIVYAKTNGNAEAVANIRDGFGGQPIGLLGMDISLTVLLILTGIVSILVLIYSSYRLNKRIKA